MTEELARSYHKSWNEIKMNKFRKRTKKKNINNHICRVSHDKCFIRT